MRKLGKLGCGLLCVLLMLSGCVAKVGPVCVGTGPSGPARVMQGPVTMTIEHSVYAPSETVEVVITNNLDTPIYTRTASNCLTLDVRRIVHDEWQFLPTCWRIIEAPPGVHYNVVLAHSLGGDEVSPTGPAGALSDGTYRVGFAYSTHKPDPDPRTFLQAPVYVWSPTFQVCTCRSC